MVQQVTHNIKVSVETYFEGSFYSDQKKQYAFSYEVLIENQSQHSVQLNSRFWLIKDALNETETVEGEGVIGEQPIIEPGGKHQYNSGCVLVSPFGSMQGYYKMKTPFSEIEVTIPLFKLNAPFAMN
ncbi:Co2+/Mg2+ efflux protein ApaG [Aureisphaera sp. CAU 1614]|uniref:Co2+/Mg2+ efflux protein ApaG n=1 Tax=Halomarinibacterium sedimenti TaxID=2857106 RepID=A0A9X1JW44_9FLAO|nr:Co2+/Mg2+ efflux protein ApaG [Halomarinibacterium sedimenti]MBW2936648.1 Co2+/Mg2+ efflux protein ApaG [Halomarinibacterium sedimenti]